MRNLLVVEDEPGIALGLEDTLRLEGYGVEVVANGAHAIRRAMETRFDLIVLDVMLPERNGFEVCFELRKAGLSVPIIFLSARTQESDRIAGLDLGANDYVTKPFSPRELAARVRSMLRTAEHTGQDLKRLENEMQAAARVQQRLFPSSYPVVAGVEYAGQCLPARGVSGDYYDFFLLPSGRLALLLADVCGKGMAAALVAASIHATVRSYGPLEERNCGAVLAAVNRLLFQTTAEDRFATVFYGVYDPGDHALTWSNAGHCAPFVTNASGSERLEALTMPAGIAAEIPALQRTRAIRRGDRLLAFSDGVSEAAAVDGSEFGEGGILRVMRDNPTANAIELSRAILERATSFAGERQLDDLTVLAALF